MPMIFGLILVHVISIFFSLQKVSFAVDSISPFFNISDGKTLVSKEGIFELGFFSPGTPTNRYVGIWYKKIPVRKVVWVANRCSPINDFSGVLTINSTGNLVLLNQNKSVVVWSTNSSKKVKKRPIVELLDSGNLVLRDEEDRNLESNYLWQSFDYPADTFLPGMKFGWDIRKGLNRKFSAWKTWDDPCPGDLSYGSAVKLDIYPEAYVWKGTEIYYRSGPWNGIGISGLPLLKPNQLFDTHFVYNGYELYCMYNLKINSVSTRIVMNQTNSAFQLLIWMEGGRSWKLYGSAPQDDCDIYGRCGANGNCVISENAVCQCLNGFKPKSQQRWDLRDWSEGCVRKSPLNCQDGERDEEKHKDEDGFVRLVGIKMPDTRNTWFNDGINLKECRAKCLSNCSCSAYSNRDIKGYGKGCRIWFGGLMDMREISDSEQPLYVRIPASELARAARKLRAIIVVSVVGSLSGMLLVGYYIFRKTLKGRNRKTTRKNKAKEEDFELPLFSQDTISIATNNFSVNIKLGEGGFGPVYRGMLEDGQEIAVKRLSLSSRQGINELKNEVILIAKLQHRNLVKLLGCCIDKEEKLLVYEYMPNKSLDCFIFDKERSKLLQWPKRFEIICGIARGLQYLHQDSRLRIVHRDLKASNILLDKEMNPKISDFGMARTFGEDETEGKTNRVVGTYGYMAPEYAFSGLFSTNSDIFSFGTIMLEIVSGKRSIGFHHENNEGFTLIGRAWALLKEGRPLELIDAQLRESYDNLQEVLRCIHVGLLCVQQRPKDRPSMSSVVLMLGSETELAQPKPPGYFIERNSQEDCSSSKDESLSKNTMTRTTIMGR
ncbi:G-type lectin S-receptor-like serine/threonine-protein kinase At4g27290 isoform X2 [Morus notabilis]|uniref:G-type lectin S-receptor-like serine/threonine-protein kinase At4g27290 isoform X2 n=1 Tax=Morus notabilis TaxID=981085 RepID=UPI000CECE463|nr:G-type lectin S-receptor-like serine/threonine-protein kinase At4g27290 isoform X2 [Morus notabilis]